jgi:hypothetical protein
VDYGQAGGYCTAQAQWCRPQLAAQHLRRRQSLDVRPRAAARATDGIVTGTGTVTADNPSFTVRHVADHADRRRVLVVCGQQANTPEAWLAARQQQFDVLFCRNCSDLPALLGKTDALWVLVEAGPTLLAALKEMNLWDDWLTIRQNAAEVDHYTVSTRHDVTPLALFPEWARCTQEQACFPVLSNLSGSVLAKSSRVTRSLMLEVADRPDRRGRGREHCRQWCLSDSRGSGAEYARTLFCQQ